MDEWLALEARAKVNLFLRIYPRQPDGYHPIETALCRISLCDRVRLRLRGQGIELRVEGGGDVPLGPENLAARAAELFLSEVRAAQGVEIVLEKRIPVAAGLGGGSSDAAAVLRGLNMLLGDPLPKEHLLDLAASIGSDVPFFVFDEPLAFASGRGEKLRPLGPLPRAPALVVSPRIAISTTEAYRAWDEAAAGRREAAEPRRSGAGPGPYPVWRSWQDVAPSAESDFEPVILRRHPELAEIKERVLATGPLFAILSGSGAAFFAPYADEAARDAARHALASLPGVDLFAVAAPD